MTIRIRPAQPSLDTERLSTLLTQALLSRPQDDGVAAANERPGAGWVRWGDAVRSTSTTLRALD